MQSIKNLRDLDQKVIKSLQNHVRTGYEESDIAVQTVINAVRQGKIRLSRQSDTLATYEDLAGDCFNVEVNDNIPADQLKREEANFRRKIARTGVWVMISEHWTGRNWEKFGCHSGNMIGGFVGNDFFGSGYELQVMEAALTAYNNQPLDADGFVIDPFRQTA